MVDAPGVATMAASEAPEEVVRQAAPPLKEPSAVVAKEAPKEEPTPAPEPAPPPKPVEEPAAPAAVPQNKNPREFTVVLRKTAENSRLGLTVDIANSVCMVVDKVNGGLLAAWNQANPDMEVKPGDRVMTVNGQSGDAVELTQVCKVDDVLEMKIVRDRRD